MRCTSHIEQALRRQGFRLIAGTDEVGRGALFGPVVAAAVILDPDRPIRGLNDSKQLDPDVRKALALVVQSKAIAWAIGEASVDEIDRINIYQASRLAMKRAVEILQPACDYLLVDALRLDCAMPQRALIQGDCRVRAIAAASILAKVYRDTRIAELESQYPGYGLAAHKGYATPQHLQALERLGPTVLHRRSFAPVWMSAQMTLCL